MQPTPNSQNNSWITKWIFATKNKMYTLQIMCRTNSTLLISVCALLPILTSNAVATTTTTVNNGTPAITNYQQNSNYKDAAAAAAIAVTAAMSAAALPTASRAAATTKDYSQQLPQNYPFSTAVDASANRHNVGGGDVVNVATEPLYRNYFENSDVDRAKIGSTTLIRRDQKAQWRMSTVSGEQAAANGAAEETAMTVAGFVPTTLTAAGQHYVAGMNAAIDGAQAGSDFTAHEGVEANNRERAMSANNDANYAYLPPEGKIDYEINDDNYERSNEGNERADGGAGTYTESDGIKMSADEVYELYKYNMQEYVAQMQRVLAESAVDNMQGRYDEATTDVDSSNQGGGSYFENRLSGLQNYFMPTYQIEQFSNYHNQAERAPSTVEQHQQEEGEQEQKSNRGKLHEQPQLRPLALYNGGGGDGASGVDNNAMLQQFNNGANIENYANDREKLRYYAKQPMPPPPPPPPQQQQQLQHERQHQQQQQMKEQQQHEQQQQLQLTHQLREYPELMQFALQHQHTPSHTLQLQRLAPANLKATNQRQQPNDKTALSARRRQQHQLQHPNHDAVSSSSLQVIGNVARRRLLPTNLNFHIDTDSRSSNEKSSISENVADSTNSPSQFHYVFTQAHTHATQPAASQVSQLVDDSVNEIDDTHNNIDETGSSIDDSASDTSSAIIATANHHDQRKYYVTTSHNQQHKEIVPLNQHSSALLPEYTLPPIASTIRHTPASSAALAGIPLSRHVEVTRHIPVITDYQRIHVPYNQSVPIEIPQPIVNAIPRPYAIRVPVTKTIAVPKVQDVRIPVEKVKPYPVERPVPFVVERRVPYMVEKQVAKPIYYPYPVQVPIVKTIVHKVQRRPHNFLPYHPHSSSYPLSLGHYHLQQQHHASSPHLFNTLQYTRTGHLG